MKRLLCIVSIIFLATGCEKTDPFVETDEGKNVLGFYLNGEPISYETSGGFIYEYRHLVHAEWINSDSLEISARLSDYYYKSIAIKIAVADISTRQNIIDPDITLMCFYKRYPLAPDDYSDGGFQETWCYASCENGTLSFRRWDPLAGILSGNFEFEGEVPVYDGSVKHISVTKGNFDVQIEEYGY